MACACSLFSAVALTNPLIATILSILSRGQIVLIAAKQLTTHSFVAILLSSSEISWPSFPLQLLSFYSGTCPAVKIKFPVRLAGIYLAIGLGISGS